MQVYTARQPILNNKQEVVAYELLFRESKRNCFPAHIPADVATAKLLVNSYLSVGLDEITEGKPALINFPAKMLAEHLLHMVPYKNIIVEVLETVEPNDENYQVLRRLFHNGFPLALDDFIYSSAWDRFLPFIKLIKIDIIATPLPNVAPLLSIFKDRKIKLLAEKIETHEEFRMAQELGFNFFQGYFFYRPEVLVGAEIESNQQFLLSIYGEVMKQDFSYKKLEGYFEQDIGITYKLLRFVNSSLFDHCQEIVSIKQAIAFLGENQIRKFVCLIVLAQLNPTKPTVLIQNTVIRARLCELIANAMGLRKLADSAFLTGLFSTIDAILDKPMESVLSALPLSEDINNALIEHKGELAECLAVTLAYINGDWDSIDAFTNLHHVQAQYLIASCDDAYNWFKIYQNSVN
jgi:c-di-GMP phosphodiesterase